MKCSRAKVNCQVHSIPNLRFESQKMTAFGGLIILQQLFSLLRLKERIRDCFKHLPRTKIYAPATLFLQLIIHLLLGFREISDCRYYEDDPMVKRLLGLRSIPTKATISRMLRDTDDQTVEKARYLLRQLVLDRLAILSPVRLTLDFDGSVQSTKRFAEGSAVGFNKKKKGARSYYPLFCTISQTGQVFDVLHRSGNVHDSNGAKAFMKACISRIRQVLPGAQLEVRMDSAFFDEKLLDGLALEGVTFTASVPFERFPKLKQQIEKHTTWTRCSADTCFFELSWKPKCWRESYRFLCFKRKKKQQQKGPIQLDLFEPYEFGYEFKVVVTNQAKSARHTMSFHEGRGAQEGIFAELKTSCGVDYVPVRRQNGNQLYLIAGLLAHNLSRELQMQTASPRQRTTPNRGAFWRFEKLTTLRKTFFSCIGRLTRPQGFVTLTLSLRARIKGQFLNYLSALDTAV